MVKDSGAILHLFYWPNFLNRATYRIIVKKSFFEDKTQVNNFLPFTKIHWNPSLPKYESILVSDRTHWYIYIYYSSTFYVMPDILSVVFQYCTPLKNNLILCKRLLSINISVNIYGHVDFLAVNAPRPHPPRFLLS